MKASETKLQAIIGGQKQYVVPLFQRPYKWNRKHWNELWEDLLDLCEDGLETDHFIGSVVTMPLQTTPQGLEKLLLIDGQQRLTTIFVLLAIIRDIAKELPLKLSDEIEQLFLLNHFQEDMNRLKVLPTQVHEDRLAFMQIMENQDSLTENQITKAYNFFEKRLQSKNRPELVQLKQVITNNLIIVHVVLDKDDDPYKIFESLNARGEQLSQADLIRNYFFMRIHEKGQQQMIQLYESYWKPMQEEIGENLSEFFRHFLMKDSAMVKKKDVYFALKKYADSESLDEIIEELKNLENFSRYYEKLLYPIKEPVKKISESIERLNRIEITVAYPFLLNIYHDYATQLISENEFI